MLGDGFRATSLYVIWNARSVVASTLGCTAPRLHGRLHDSCHQRTGRTKCLLLSCCIHSRRSVFKVVHLLSSFLQLKNIDLNFGKGQFLLFQWRARGWWSQAIKWNLKAKRRKQDSTCWAHSKYVIYISPFKVHFCCQIQLILHAAARNTKWPGVQSRKKINAQFSFHHTYTIGWICLTACSPRIVFTN